MAWGGPWIPTGNQLHLDFISLGLQCSERSSQVRSLSCQIKTSRTPGPGASNCSQEPGNREEERESRDEKGIWKLVAAADGWHQNVRARGRGSSRPRRTDDRKDFSHLGEITRVFSFQKKQQWSKNQAESCHRETMGQLDLVVHTFDPRATVRQPPKTKPENTQDWSYIRYVL